MRTLTLFTASKFPRPDVKVSSAYIWIEPARNICFRQMKAGSGDDCVKDGNKVKIRYELYDNQSRKLRYSTYSKQDPEILGPGKNEICQGLYEGIVGMQLGEIRRIVLPPSSDLTREHSKSGYWNIQKLLPNQKPSADSEEYRTYDVKLLKIIP
ncbi:unnamed protein product [Dovyalis caffra]|uniref:peptidylprolyl isomerase n=1 Tax=Dovyalis caffra TaxID=77055 RepID=A0AAV1QSQ6_9ROSI|nr:unnamed protein product [Dovyalis caffra]